MIAQPTPIVVLPADEVRQIIRDAYEAGRSAGDIPDKVWTAKECAAFLGCSVGTVYTLAQNGEIPCRRIGDRYVFHPSAVAEWVANRG